MAVEVKPILIRYAGGSGSQIVSFPFTKSAKQLAFEEEALRLAETYLNHSKEIRRDELGRPGDGDLVVEPYERLGAIGLVVSFHPKEEILVEQPKIVEHEEQEVEIVQPDIDHQLITPCDGQAKTIQAGIIQTGIIQTAMIQDVIEHTESEHSSEGQSEPMVIVEPKIESRDSSTSVLPPTTITATRPFKPNQFCDPNLSKLLDAGYFAAFSKISLSNNTEICLILCLTKPTGFDNAKSLMQKEMEKRNPTSVPSFQTKASNEALLAVAEVVLAKLRKGKKAWCQSDAAALNALKLMGKNVCGELRRSKSKLRVRNASAALLR